MSVLDGYHEEDYNIQIEPGEHQLKIVKAEEKTFNSGNEGLKIELANKDKTRFFYHIIKNDFFNQNLTRFYDCFKIRRGETDLDQWIGRFGWAFIDKGKPNDNGRQFMEIRYLIVRQPGANSPAQENPLNEKRRQLIADINAVITRINSDLLPYFTEQERGDAKKIISENGPNKDGLQKLAHLKAYVLEKLKEKEAASKPIPGWEDAPAQSGEEPFTDDVLW
jgi:hypothetical protein